MDIDKDERKRLVRLQEDGPKGVNGSYLKNLTYPDLLLLLEADPTIQKLIRKIVQPMLAASEGEEAIAAESGEDSSATDSVSRYIKLPVQPPPIKIEKVIEKVPYEVRVEVPVHDPLRGQLLPELKLLQAVQADTELAVAWLEASESEGRQLMRLLSMVSEWDEVLRLWGRLADRCKKDQRTATGVELQILQAVLAFNNLRWRDCSASLVSAQIGADFHHETMERGTPKGSTVQAVWLPGIANAAGQIQKKPVVKTN
jgi:hypothetical protein